MKEIFLTTEEEIEDLICGCGFMGTGGGGKPQDGLKMLKGTLQAGEKIRLIPPNEIPDSAWICTGGYIGSIAPRSGDEQLIEQMGLKRRVEKEIVQAVKELEAYAKVTISAMAACELGGLNTPACLDTAANLGLPAIDGDFAGRAVPETVQLRFSIGGKEIWPRVFCDYARNVVVIKEAISPRMMERIQKHIAMASLGLVGAAGHLMRGEEMKRFINPRSLSRCISIGQAIRKAKGGKEGFAEKVAESIGGWVLFQGIVLQKVWEDKGGYMIGEFELEGEKSFQGHTFKIWFKNENHISWFDREPFVTSPDIISVIDLDSGEVPTNTDIDRGNHLGVIGLRAAEEYRTGKGLEVFCPSYFGFNMKYVPIEERLANR